MSGVRPAPNLRDYQREHLRNYLATDGQKGYIWKSLHPGAPDVPTLLLTVTGRKSGQRYIQPLIYGEVPGGYVVVASKGGAPEHPGWYLNLVANPEVEVQVLAKKFKARARTLAGEERRAVWDQIVKMYPPYDKYRQATQRDIPLVVLEPA